MLAWGLDALYHTEEVSLDYGFVECFYHKGCWILSTAFFASTEMIMCLSFVLLILCKYWLTFVCETDPACISWKWIYTTNSTWWCINLPYVSRFCLLVFFKDFVPIFIGDFSPQFFFLVMIKLALASGQYWPYRTSWEVFFPLLFYFFFGKFIMNYINFFSSFW